MKKQNFFLLSLIFTLVFIVNSHGMLPKTFICTGKTARYVETLEAGDKILTYDLNKFDLDFTKIEKINIKESDAVFIIKTNPREFYLDGVTDSIALILDFGLIDVAAGKAASLGKAFSNILETELAFLTDNTKMIPATTAGVIDVEAVEAIQTPMLNSFKMAEELNCKAVQYGGKTVDNALKVIEKNPKLVASKGGISDAVAKFSKSYNPDPRTPVRRKGQSCKDWNTLVEFDSTIINGRKYSGHAIDRMNQRGFTPSKIEDVIKNGITFKNKESGRLSHYDAVDNISVITEKKTGEVVTVFNGLAK